MSNDVSKVEAVSEEATALETMMGGREITVTIRPPTRGAPARHVQVWVRQLEIEEYPELLKRFDDERGQIEMYCQIKVESRKQKAESGEQEEGVSERAGESVRGWVPVPAGWAKGLTAESHDVVMEEGERLNRDFFGRWLRRRMAKLESIRPGVTEELFAQIGTGAKSLEGGSPGARSRSVSMRLGPDGKVSPG